ncbi:MAG: hypothetical protein ACPGUE_14700 [Marinomonas sp.]
MSKWISVSDKLPLELLSGSDKYKSIEVLVTDGYEVGLHNFEAGSIGRKWRSWSSYGDINSNEIIAWQYKPEPPKQTEPQLNAAYEG